VPALITIAAAHGVPLVELGGTGGETLEFVDLFATPISVLRAASESTFPALFG
jgi:hypothetical protein